MVRRSSLADNPLLRVSRPVSACSRCRVAKVKCDGKLPACTACEKAGRQKECTSGNDQFARGKERSYVAALELKIEKLEKRLAYARARKASMSMHDEADVELEVEPGRKDSFANIRDAVRRKAARKRENSDINALVSEFGYMTINATTRDFDPSINNMTFARLILAASINDPVPDPTASKLPAEPTARALVEHYLHNIYPLYPAFSESSLTKLLDKLYGDATRSVESPESWVFWMVLAIGSSAQSQNAGDQYYRNGVEYVARALPHADQALQPGYNVQLQALLLLTQYSMLDPAHFDSWQLIGFTCRALVDIGFHQEDTFNQQSTDETEARRRTFYSIYALDRATSMAHARAFSFADDAIAVELPAPHPPGFGGPDRSVHLFKLRRLQSGWYQTLIQSDSNDGFPDATSFIWKTCLEMREWAAALPRDLPVNVREMLDQELRYSYVYCIAPSARAPHITPYGRTLIFEYTIAYIFKMHEICQAGGTRHTFYTYFDALRVYFMGCQFVAVLRDAAEMLLAARGIEPPHTLLGAPEPPPIPENIDAGGGFLYYSENNLDRSLWTLERVSLILKKFGERWEVAEQLLSGFEMMSDEVTNALKARKSQAAADNQQPSGWGDVDVSQAYLGGRAQ